MSPGEIRRTESYFDSAESGRLFLRTWCGASPSRVVVFAHGLAEHCGRYDRLASWLTQEGSAVFAFDFVGHGQSSGVRGHSSGFEAWIENLDACVARASSAHPGLPVFAMGQGFGSAVVLASLLDGMTPLRGAVLAGLGRDTGPMPRGLRIRLAGRLWPTLRVACAWDPNSRCRDPEIVRRFLEDELVAATVSAATLRHWRALLDSISGRAQELARPVLLLHGSEDAIHPFEDAQSLERECGGLAELRIYTGARHEIFQEGECAKQWQADLREWFQATEAREADRGT